jgi:protein-L-isoaspartate(D-aspartate) O-methyltransferase
MAHLTRANADHFAATLQGSVFFVDFGGARDPAVSSELAQALRRDEGAGVRSLRCDVHTQDESCWLHGSGWCFSRLAEIAGERT